MARTAAQSRANDGDVQITLLALIYDKEGCGGAIWTNLDVTAVIKQNDHIGSCPVDENLAYKMEKKALLKKQSTEEAKPIPAIFAEESPVSIDSGHFPVFKRVKSTMYNHRSKRYPKLPEHRRDLEIPDLFKTTKVGDEFLLWQSASRHILVFATGSNIRLLAAMRILGIDDIGTYGYIFQALINKAAVLRVNLNPETIICDLKTALIPPVQGYLPNTRAVRRKVGELGLKTRYRQHEETKRKIRMLLATAFLPVPQVDTGVSLLEAGTTGTLAALFQYFRQEWMTDERLPLWNDIVWHNRLNRKPAKGHNGLYELLQILIAEQGIMGTLIQQVLSGNATVGDLRRVNSVYAEKQEVVAQYTEEYNNGRRTLEQKSLQSETYEHWVCRRAKRGCRGSIYSNLDVDAILNSAPHADDCAPDNDILYKMEKKTVLKRRAAKEMKTVPQIYHEEASSASADLQTAGLFPTYKSVKTAMYSKRAQRFPRLPPTRQQLEIPPHWRITKSGRRFLLYKENLNILSDHSVWSMDGTFKIVPEWYQQLSPSMFLLRAAVLGVVLLPQTIICDFETALIPAVRIQGCYFHFCQAVPILEFIHEAAKKKTVKMLLAEAFLPFPEVPAAVDLLGRNVTGSDAALFGYFREEWMTFNRMPLWNVYNVQIRTNNHLEGWHFKVNQQARKHHLSFYELLQLLIDEQS
ncbi:hypothetical protein T10_953 [Trichinella papuae]|uniref:MULE transposase domain-containing protein n=1 Tax=Trichinella papuae TaxID=268474 RepID=A0A0V1MBH9_9BILA|nr:hypothetical protein T10_953 [Trichinella papuae]